MKNRAPPRRPLVSVTASASRPQIRIAFNVYLVREASLQSVPWMAIVFEERHQRVTFISTPSRGYQGSDDVEYPLMADGGGSSGKALLVPKDQYSMLLSDKGRRRYEPRIIPQPGRAGPKISIVLEPPRTHAVTEDWLEATVTLHPVIAEAANKLYRDGHYANATEAAIKALCDRVRLRSGKELDGVDLMKTVFSRKNPILRFNDLRDRSDHDEQEGFMMLFAGAVTGLRNPRAHKLIKDDRERASEFVAFVSLLAKLLDGAKNP